jgi:molybdate transport system substrate-binding protein
MTEIAVQCTNGVKEVVLELFPAFERASGHKLAATYGPTAALVESIKAGAPADVAIMTSEAIAELAQLGKVLAENRTDLARSFIGVAVRAGAPHPDIATTQALKQSLLAARSVAYSRQGASGIYFPSVLERLGIADAIKAKAVRPEGVTVGIALARGEAELGIQQISELLPVAGVEVVGPFPDEVQKVTVFSAALSAGARDAQAAKALVTFLAGGFTRDVLEKRGLAVV